MDAIAVILPVAMSRGHMVTATQTTFLRLTVIVGLFALTSAAVEAAERFRFSIAGGPVSDLLTASTLAAALVLPPWAAALAAVANYVFARGSWRGQPPHRWWYTVSAVVVTSMIVHATSLSGLRFGDMEVITAPTEYVVIDAALMALVFIACGQTSNLQRFASKTGWAVNLSTALIGVGFAFVLLHSIYLSPLVVPAVIAVSALAAHSQLREMKAVDKTTGVLAPAAWRSVAEQAMCGGTPTWTVALVMPLVPSVDSLRTCADVLASTLRTSGKTDRPSDIIGRYGDGFALAFCASVLATQNIAARLTTAIAERGVIVSVTTGYGGSVSEQLADAQVDSTSIDQLR